MEFLSNCQPGFGFWEFYIPMTTRLELDYIQSAWLINEAPDGALHVTPIPMLQHWRPHVLLQVLLQLLICHVLFSTSDGSEYGGWQMVYT